MAIIKCKMCGGDLDLVEGASTAECEFCGSIQTIPKVDDEKKLTLFARANRLRAACEFDKAAAIYEAIVADFPEEAEAYWGLVLCKYGIEYVDDSATGKKIPTCHRSSFDSVMEDSDLEQALENADAIARKVYREEAKQIEEIRKGIIEVSGKEQPYDIFICYKETDENGERTIDSVIAQDVYDALTSKGYRVFFSRITLEDKLGQEYEPYIFAALNSAKIMLAFGTDYEYYNAVWVKNEWSRFLKLMAKDKSKHLIPCYKGIDAYDMPKEFARLQAQDLGKIGATQDLLRGIAKILSPQGSTVVVTQKPTANTSALVTRGQFALDDGDWKKADEYFERALDENPEDSKAYVGKVLVRYQLSSIEQLQNSAINLDDSKDFDRAIRFASENDKLELIQIKETTAKRIIAQHLVNYINSFRITRETKEFYETVHSLMAIPSVENYEKAAQMYHDAYERKLNPGVVSEDAAINAAHRLEVLRLLINNDEYTAEELRSRLGYSVIGNVQRMIRCGCLEKFTNDSGDTVYAIAGTAQKKEQLRIETTYTKAMSLMTTADNYEDFTHAAIAFGQLGDYLDAPEKCEYCKKQSNDMKEKHDAEIARQEELRRQEIARQEAQQREHRRAAVYSQQRSVLLEAKDIQILLIAAENLERLDDYRDCRELARQCREKAARIAAEQKEREEAEARRKAQQAKWRNAGVCQHCGGALKGFFSKKCVHCGKPKDY